MLALFNFFLVPLYMDKAASLVMDVTLEKGTLLKHGISFKRLAKDSNGRK